MNEIKLSDLEKGIMKLSGKTVKDKTAGPALRNVFFKYLNDKKIVFEKIKGNSRALIKITKKNGEKYLCAVVTRDAGKTNHGFTVGTKSAENEKEKYNNKYYVIFVDVDEENNSVKRSLIVESEEAYNKEIISDRTKGVILTDTTITNLDDYAGNNLSCNFEEWLEEN